MTWFIKHLIAWFTCNTENDSHMHSKIWVHLYEEPLKFISPFNERISSNDHQKEAKALNYKIAILILQIHK